MLCDNYVAVSNPFIINLLSINLKISEVVFSKTLDKLVEQLKVIKSTLRSYSNYFADVILKVMNANPMSNNKLTNV